MKDLIEVFKMTEISKQKRASLIIKLGIAINCEYQSSITEAVVFELVSILDPENEILTQERYLNAT